MSGSATGGNLRRRTKLTRSQLTAIIIAAFAVGVLAVIKIFAAQGPSAVLWVVEGGNSPCFRQNTPVTLAAAPPQAKCSSLAAAMTAAQNNDVVNIAPGTNYGGQNLSGTKTVSFVGAGPGITVLASLFYNAANGPTVEGVQVTGGVTSISSSNIAIKNSEINNQTYIEKTNGFLLDHIEWQPRAGQTSWGNNDMVNIYPDAHTGQANANITIQDSVLHGLRGNPNDADPHPDAIQSYNKGQPHTNIKLLRNRFYDNECINLRTNEGDEYYLENNVFGDSVQGVSGCYYYAIDVGYANVTAKYNTFTGNQQIQQTPTTTGLHQVWVGNVGNGFSAGCNSGGASGATMTRNIWTGQKCSATDKQVAKASLGMNADGTFNAGSPAIDYGDPADYPAVDKNGNTRFSGAGPDAGAFEFGAGGGTTPPPPPPQSKAGDVNGDNAVNIIDLSILLSHFGQSGQSLATGDCNGDGSVNVVDLSILLSNFGK